MANENKNKYVSPSKLSLFLENLKDTFSPLTHEHTLSDLTDYTVDEELSSISTNPVQNKVLDSEFESIATAMNALESAIDEKVDSTHEHDNLNIYDTVTGSETININAAEPQHPLEVTLSSETYTDFSNVTVTLTYEDTTQTAVANVDGTVTGLNSESEFMLTLTSVDADFDPTLVTITCRYKLDIEHVLHDYVLHVDIDGDGDGDGDGSDINGNNIIIDETLSIVGAAADAKAVGDAINNLDSEKVSVDRTINGKSLNKDIVLTAEDIGAVTETIEIDATLTTEGAAADAKATGDAINNLNTLVGSTSVADQISDALVDVEDNIYVQEEEPTDVENGSVWIDTSVDGENNIGASISGIPTITATDEDKMIQVVGGKYTLVSIKESSIATYIDEYINEALGGDY